MRNQDKVLFDAVKIAQAVAGVLKRTLSKFPLYFLPTSMVLSLLLTIIVGFSFRIFAPKAATEEHLPPARMKSSVSKIKLHCTLDVSSVTSSATCPAGFPSAIRLPASTVRRPTPPERLSV